MEVLGAVASGITLAALFKCTFEALDLIHLYQTQDVDFKRLQLQYSLEKCRLYTWGVQMGLADDSKQNLLSEWHSKELVEETLREVIIYLTDGILLLTKLTDRLLLCFLMRRSFGRSTAVMMRSPLWQLRCLHLKPHPVSQGPLIISVYNHQTPTKVCRG